ncbi:MAG: tetratricopeptide repeat protein [Myxococcales bacterium]|nr:tetratricopeptide repeat protein [Myxococcales bacterium]
MEPTDDDPGTDLRADLDGLRRRLDDHGTVLRKSQQGLAELAESVARVVTLQRGRDRWVSVNSFVAYLLFTAILGGAMLVLYRSRAGELVRARDSAVAERDLARARAKTLDDQLVARTTGADHAFEYYQLVTAGKRTEAVARYGELDQALLTATERAVFEQAHKQAREEIIDAGYLTGLDAARAGDHAKAISELRRALAYEDEGPRAAQMRYFLGVALVKTGAAKEARHELELALAGRVEQAGATDARYYLASALEAAGDLEAARKEYDKFASAAAQHPLAVAARRKAMALARAGKPTN